MVRPRKVAIKGYKAKILGIIDEKMTILPKNVIRAGIQRSITSAYQRVGGNSH